VFRRELLELLSLLLTSITSFFMGDGLFLHGEVDMPFTLVSVSPTDGSRFTGERLLFRFELVEFGLPISELLMLGSIPGKSLLLFDDHKSPSVGASSHDMVVD